MGGVDPPEVLFGFNGEERFVGFVFSVKVFMLERCQSSMGGGRRGGLCAHVIWRNGNKSKRKRPAEGGGTKDKWMEKKCGGIFVV